MKRLLLILVATLAFAACGADDPPDVPNDLQALGVDLVTEDELLLHVAKQAALDASLVVAGMMISDAKTPAGEYELQVCDTGPPEVDWVKSRTISYVIGITASHDYGADYCGPEGFINFHWTFGKSVYVDGKVDISNCHKLPGGGTQTSGEYQDVTNNSSDAISQHLEHKVTESESHENSLSETVDTTAGQTVEAGASFPGGEAKATVSFEEHFGLEKGTLDAKESTSEQTVSLDVTIEPSQVLGVTYTLDDTVTLCDSNINSTVDWAGLDLRVWRHRCGPACDSPGMRHLSDHHVYSGGSSRDIHFHFDSIDDVVRLAAGTNPICDGCYFKLPTAIWSAEAAYHHLTWPGHYRTVEIKGTRRTTTKDSASWRIDDLSGLDKDCAADVLGNEGTPVGSIDDKLGDCK